MSVTRPTLKSLAAEVVVPPEVVVPEELFEELPQPAAASTRTARRAAERGLLHGDLQIRFERVD